MLVYGSPRAEVGLRATAREVWQRLAGCSLQSDGSRCGLIQAGQLEQAAEDAPDRVPPDGRQWLRELTDYAAARLYGRNLPAAPAFPDAGALPDIALPVQIPEGFQFYCLYPEHYLQAAENWVRDQPLPCPGAILVIGLRSIGTSLSASVAAVLRACGRQVERLTVRPRGHPWRREVSLPLRVLDRPPGPVLIVDEGPGLSGSSMEAVARCLEESGYPQIFLFPGHRGGPGAASTPAIRDLWRRTPQYCVSLEELRWNGQSLRDRLRTTTAGLLSRTEGDIQLQDWTGGKWREWVCAKGRPWPVSSGSLERTKFLAMSARGAVVWKFDGLGCLGTPTTSPPPPGTAPRLGSTLGFVGLRYIEGVALTCRDFTTAVLSRIARHIRDSAYTASENLLAAGAARLTELVRHNGEELRIANRQGWEGMKESELRTTCPLAYGDGRMAPHEWIRDSSGGLVKTDWHGHTQDHTLIGEQSILWDLAGAIVEWQLRPDGVNALVRRVGLSGALPIRNYCVGYAVFRAGVCSLLEGQLPSDDPERVRLAAARCHYSQMARRWLDRPPEPRQVLVALGAKLG